METEKYVEEQNRIAKIAFSLFREKGYDKTSIKEIADAANIQKALVQYYFPKKDLFIDIFIQKSLDTVVESMEQENDRNLSHFDLMYLMGYFELWYLTTSDSMKFLRLDILSNRNTTATIISVLTEWAANYLGLTTDFQKKIIFNAITFAVGGTFEYVYVKIVNNEPFSLELVVDNIAKVMNMYLGVDAKPIAVEEIITDEWINQKECEIDLKLFEQ